MSCMVHSISASGSSNADFVWCVSVEEGVGGGGREGA